MTIGVSGAQLSGTIQAIAAMFIGLFDTVRKKEGKGTCVGELLKLFTELGELHLH